jgi:hypothetical protein
MGPARRIRALRWLLGLAAIVAVALVAIAAYVAHLVSPESLKARIEAQLGAALGSGKLGSAHLGWGRSLVLTDLEIGHSGQPGVHLQIPKIEIALNGQALLAGRLKPEAVELHSPRLSLAAGGVAALPVAPTVMELGTSLDLGFPIHWADFQLTVQVGTGGGTLTLTHTDRDRTLTVAELLKAVKQTRFPLPTAIAGHLESPGRTLDFTVGGGQLTRTASGIDLSGVALTVGGQALRPDVHVTLGGSVPRIEASLPTTRVEPAALGALWSSFKLGAVPKPSSGAVEITAAVRGAATNPEMAAEIRVDRLAFPAGARGALTLTSGNVVITPSPRGGMLISPQKVKFELGDRAPVKLTVSRGDAEITTSSLEVHDLELEVPGRPQGVTLAGTVGREGPKAPVDLVARVRRGALLPLVELFDPQARPNLEKRNILLEVEGQLRLKGTVSDPVPSGELAVHGGTVGLGRPGSVATVQPGGKIRLEGRFIRWSEAPLQVGEDRLMASGHLEITPGTQKNLLEVRVEGKKIDANRLAVYLPPEASGLDLSGRVAHLRVRLEGVATNPSLTADVSVAGGKIAITKAHIPPTRLEAGEVHVVGRAATVDKVRAMMGEGEHSGVLVSGSVGANAILDLAVKGETVPPGPLVKIAELQHLPALSGTVSLDAHVRGPAARPLVTGRIGMKGLHVRWPKINGPLSFTRGELEVAEKEITLRRAQVNASGDLLDVEAGGRRGTTSLNHLRISGTIDLGRIAAWPAQFRVSGRTKVHLAGNGPAMEPHLTGTLVAPSLAVASARGSQTLTAVSAKIEMDEGEVSFPSISATLRGAVFRGAIDTDGVVQLSTERLDIRTLMDRPTPDRVIQGGLLSFKLKSGTAEEVAGLEIRGEAQLTDFVVDISRNMTLKSMNTKAGAGETGSALATGLLGATGLGFLAGASAASAHFYNEVLTEALAMHTIGTIRANVTLAKGHLELAPLTGENVQGKIGYDLASSRLSGKLDFVQLGRARFLEVALGGTLTDPQPTVATGNVRLGGKGPPGGKRGGNSALNLNTLVKPALGVVVGWPLPVADLLIGRLFGRRHKRHRPAPSPSPSPSPVPSPR